MLIRGDARHIPLKAGVVQSVVTSPPYWGLRDYGLGESGIGLERTPEEYVAQIVAVFREVWRVLRDDGMLWLNLGDCYAGSPVGSFNGGGFKDKSAQTGGRDMSGVATSGTLDKLKGSGLKPKDLVGIPWRVAFALQADGWYLRSDIIWAKPNPMPESVRDRPTKAHEYVFLLTKSERYYFNQNAVRESYARLWDASKPNGRTLGSGSTYTIDAGMPTAHKRQARPIAPGLGRNLRSVWTIATQPYSGAHFATFPQEIPERCIKAGTKPGDVVLDPFCGSGTTVMVAQDLGRVGIGLDLKYQELAAERIGGPLFAAVVNQL
jgi:DNA modification methylase